MKRMLAILITAALLCSMTGCTQNNGNSMESVTEPSGATLEVIMSHSYRSQEILKEEELGFTKYYQFGDNIFTYSSQSDATAVIGVYSPETGSFVRKDFPYTDMVGVSVLGEQFDVMLRQTNRDTYESIYLCKTYDASLNEISSEDVTEIWGNDTWGQSWARDAQGNAYMSVLSEGIVCWKADGTTAVVPQTEGNETLYTGRDGSVYAIYDRRTMLRLTPDAAETIPLELPRVGGNYGELLPGNAQYDALCYTMDYLYGMTFSDGSMEELMSWQESDFTASNDQSGTLLLSDGRILLSATDNPQDPFSPYMNLLLTARTQEEVDSMKLISMADLSSSSNSTWLDQMVCKFNRQAESCRIVTKNYYDENAADFGTSALTQDLLDGVIPDILMSIPDYRMFSNKGMFEDLSVWMENDPDFHEDEYLMNFFDALRYKGRLECMGFRFAVNTYAAKTEFLGGAERLTLADYADLELPEGMELLSSADRAAAFDILLRSQLGEFVDYENASCSFDSEEFINLLKWFGSFPEKAAVQDDYAYRENRALLYPTQIGSLRDYHGTVQYWFDNADVTLTGTPVDAEGNGGVFATMGLITVSSASQYKEEIWEFIKFCLNEENQSDTGLYGFPVNLNALESCMKSDQQVPDEINKTVFSFAGESVEVTPATAEEAAELTEYLKGIASCSFLDDFVTNIVQEETDKFFSGDCTTEDAARVIQSRVSLYLAEQY